MNEITQNGDDGAPPSKPAPRRKRLPHLPVLERHNGSIIVFVTVCTQGRKPVLARPDAVAVLRQAWAKADIWRVGRWVVMPDHIHLFCSPGAWPP